MQKNVHPPGNGLAISPAHFLISGVRQTQCRGLFILAAALTCAATGVFGASADLTVSDQAAIFAQAAGAALRLSPG